MHSYDFRCDACQKRFTLRYKTYADYDSASPRCPQCESAELTRVISQVAIPKSKRNYTKMSSGEMLSVLESGDSGQVNEMFRQVEGGGEKPDAPARKPPSVDKTD